MSYITSRYHFLFKSYGLNTKNFSVKKLKFLPQLVTVITSKRNELRSCNVAQLNRWKKSFSESYHVEFYHFSFTSYGWNTTNAFQKAVICSIWHILRNMIRIGPLYFREWFLVVFCVFFSKLLVPYPSAHGSEVALLWAKKNF